MRLRSFNPILFAAAGLLLSGCASDDGALSPEYLGVETRLLEGDLVNFQVLMRGARDGTDVARYAECAAAQYALIRGYGFARHLRTNIDNEADFWKADAIYTISASLPDGIKKLDAEVVTANCSEDGIPTV